MRPWGVLTNPSYLKLIGGGGGVGGGPIATGGAVTIGITGGAGGGVCVAPRPLGPPGPPAGEFPRPVRYWNRLLRPTWLSSPSVFIQSRRMRASLSVAAAVCFAADCFPEPDFTATAGVCAGDDGRAE